MSAGRPATGYKSWESQTRSGDRPASPSTMSSWLAVAPTSPLISRHARRALPRRPIDQRVYLFGYQQSNNFPSAVMFTRRHSAHLTTRRVAGSAIMALLPRASAPDVSCDRCAILTRQQLVAKVI
jgi:hypothetical protein